MGEAFWLLRLWNSKRLWIGLELLTFRHLKGNGPGESKRANPELIDSSYPLIYYLDLAGVRQKILSHSTTDHYPICIKVDGIHWGPVPFRLDNKWLGKENFKKLGEDIWQNCVVWGCASYRFAQKLKTLKNVIKVWTREVMKA